MARSNGLRVVSAKHFFFLNFGNKTPHPEGRATKPTALTESDPTRISFWYYGNDWIVSLCTLSHSA
jgi:hypothetical protein